MIFPWSQIILLVVKNLQFYNSINISYQVRVRYLITFCAKTAHRAVT